MLKKEIEGSNFYITSSGTIVDCNGKEQRVYDDGRGYLKMNIKKKDGTTKRPVKVHRLVAQAFIPNPDNLPVVNHINGDKYDNRVGNLEWTSVKGNTNHALNLHGGNFSTKQIAVIGKRGQIKSVFSSIGLCAKALELDYRGLRAAIDKKTRYKGNLFVPCEIKIERLGK
ncbi:MAG: HNH endonuclease [Bacilli bacterium]|jgi:hypothetical protein|nr:HNH endonuclease [Bacilli bacterium]